ncbi:DUF1836 domain-containing protein [Schleiferilactobacillus shenzhenensis]|uniref:DUF1836 domain-containing protein n=1 Tax=Schleiferilactobacillus shenzhenensis LY-73 TaxID=1231336 RepID=U4TJY4_9LACO|nr:DUF1836 domain-containing protein [Schleiferilactobacillus shenzhenensis]ERL63680.1 hypothetical protein L248_2450 [Schleiferilactobacillus shenzhenensis LY-73]
MFTEAFKTWVHRFHHHQLPLFASLSDIGLYMDQVISETNRYTEMITGTQVTKSMVNSYVKQDLVSRPDKKRYGRKQLAQIILVTLLKTLYSLDVVHQYLAALTAELSWQEAYDLWVHAYNAQAAATPDATIDVTIPSAQQASPAVRELIHLATKAIVAQRVSDALVQAMDAPADATAPHR